MTNQCQRRNLPRNKHNPGPAGVVAELERYRCNRHRDKLCLIALDHTRKIIETELKQLSQRQEWRDLTCQFKQGCIQRMLLAFVADIDKYL